jgi:transcription initiation factor TFIID subunit 2
VVGHYSQVFGKLSVRSVLERAFSTDMEDANGLPGAAAEVVEPLGFRVAHQKVDLEIDFQSQTLRGSTEITIHPDGVDLKTIKLNLRQNKVTLLSIKEALTPDRSYGVSPTYKDPYDNLTLHPPAGLNQHYILADRIKPAVKVHPEKELRFNIPKKIRIVPVDEATVHTEGLGTIEIKNPTSAGGIAVESTQAIADTSVAKFTALIVTVEFTSKNIRDGLHFVNHRPGNGRYPYAYTRNGSGPGRASCLFPCIDELNSRNTWDITIKCPRTIGDALRQKPLDGLTRSERNGASEESAAISRPAYEDREVIVLCSGEMTDEIMDKTDLTKKSVSFSCSMLLSAQQIGFAVGPFEHVHLSELRGAQADDDLGQNAVDIRGYCLPGRTKELKNTCLPTARAMDFFVRAYAPCPFKTFRICFVEDLPSNTTVSAGFCLCSNRMLYPGDIIDPSIEVTRDLVLAIASQWVGINVIPQESADTWATVGIAHYMAEAFMRQLCGNNEFRFRMKQQADLVCELDRDRPSLLGLGALLHVDPSVLEFIAMKAPLVLFILDRRIAKVAGVGKMPQIIERILRQARYGELANGANTLSMDAFQKTCERFYHAKIDDFLQQWVHGAGCPRFKAFQRFNKKKVVVEMLIQQTQGDNQTQGAPAPPRNLDPDMFMRDVREDFDGVYAAPVQNVFTGPMTIRIHEADGTPYEHVVEIKEAKTTFDIPYNTKYKRLKRSKKQRERNAAAAAADPSEAENEALLYCLGDVLQTPEEVTEWKLTEWSDEDMARMESESYEWIRLDADFEWICQITLQMPGYMFVSQLQQDRDVVAQYESINAIKSYQANGLSSTVMVRTLMDRRYFHGIRTAAADGLVKSADETVDYVGLFHLKKAFEEMFCASELESRMTRPNDFSDRPAYLLQCKIIEAISKVRDAKGGAPREVKEFLLEKLKFNDNSVNEYSDCFYVATLMKAITEAVIAKPKFSSAAEVDLMDTEAEDERNAQHRLEQDCLAEIDRHRRMDEWASSYQNIYTRTALECQLRLSKAGIGHTTAMHFLPYTRPNNFDMLRLTAFKNLLECKIFENDSVLRYYIYCLASDPSPWIRENLRRAFGKALAIKAIGETTAEIQQPQEGLVIEEEATLEAQQAELARKTTIDGAVSALSNELGNHKALRAALWSALNSPYIGLGELQGLLDFCRMLYPSIYEMKVVLRYPRYWKVGVEGKVSTFTYLTWIEAGIDNSFRACSNFLRRTKCGPSPSRSTRHPRRQARLQTDHL